MNFEIHAIRRFHRAAPRAQRRLPVRRPRRRLPALARAGKPAQSLATDDSRPLSDHPLARSDRMARLEAVLLLAREPLNSRRLAQLANLADGTEARTLTRKLNRIYDASGRSFRAEEVAGGFQLLTRSKFAPWLRRQRKSGDDVRLSAPAMETLSVVAYRQPVMRAEVESIRGVQCGEILRQLMERGLVRIVGRADELGRPFLYGTSKRFLQVFGLRHLDELPRADILRKAETTSIVNENSGSAEETAGTSADQEQESSPMQIVAPDPLHHSLTLGEAADASPAAVIEDRATPQAIFEKEDVEDEEDDDEDDEFDFDDDEDDEDEDEDDDLEDDDLDDDEWEEVDDDEEDDEDDFDDDDDEEWDDDDEDEWADDDWDDDDDDEDEDDEATEKL
ncbi:MAG: SMC-Scp complex subunit ScpB [Pirellulales bacterium]